MDWFLCNRDLRHERFNSMMKNHKLESIRFIGDNFMIHESHSDQRNNVLI